MQGIPTEGVRVFDLALRLRVMADDVKAAAISIGVDDVGHLTVLTPREVDHVTAQIDYADLPQFSLAVRLRRLEQRVEELEVR